jgi:hypothetical protein
MIFKLFRLIPNISGTEGLFELECKKDLLWVMARYLSSYLEQELPGGLAGFWLVLGGEPPRLTIINYSHWNARHITLYFLICWTRTIL